MIESTHDESVMLWPKPVWFDDQNKVSSIKGYQQLNDIEWPNNGFFHLHSQFHDPYKHKLPSNYNYYVLSWHGEYVDHDWIEQQQIKKPIIILHDWNVYTPSRLPDNCYSIRWIYWHQVLDKMMMWFGTEYKKNIKYKVSAFCNRITQSKMWITTSILKYINEQDRIISLSDWLEEKNVHYWQTTGNSILDDLQTEFKNNWLGKKLKIDDFTNQLNYQIYTADPAHSAYQECALHFTNESWHYSYMMNDNNKEYIFSGPNFSEKTLKCLLGGTAFVPVGQFDVYRTLRELGMKFDYGLDLSFDNDPRNLSRAEKIINLVQDLKKYTADDLYGMTLDSCLHNQHLITSGDFFSICQKFNEDSKSKLQAALDNV